MVVEFFICVFKDQSLLQLVMVFFRIVDVIKEILSQV